MHTISRSRYWSVHIIARASHQACCSSPGCKVCVGCAQAKLPDHLLLWETKPKPEGLPSVCMRMQVELHSRALLAMGAGDIVVPVFDEEPTSIIAYALSSRQASVVPTIHAASDLLHCILHVGHGTAGATHLIFASQASGEVLQCCTLSCRVDEGVLHHILQHSSVTLQGKVQSSKTASEVLLFCRK